MAPSGERTWRIMGIVLLAGILSLRLVHISADPPFTLDPGQAPYTDPGAYTSYARNQALTGDSNLYHDSRFPLFERSAISSVAQGVFAFLTPSLSSNAVVALIFSFFTIALVYLTLIHAVGRTAGVFFLILIAFNENQFFFGRLPFLENAMAFFGALGIWLLSRWERSAIAAFLAGGAFVAAAVYGKSHGLIFLAVFGLYVISSFLPRRTAPSAPISVSSSLLWLSAAVCGAALVSASWYLTVGAENWSVIVSYLREQSTGLYGAPTAHTSPLRALGAIASLGAPQPLFSRMPLATVGATLFLTYGAGLWLFGSNSKPRSITAPGVFLLSAWAVVLFLALAPWNYRPLRYDIPLIYPLCALAAVFFARLWRGDSVAGFPATLNLRRSWARILLCAALGFIIVTPLVYAVFHAYRFPRGMGSAYTSNFPLIATLTLGTVGGMILVPVLWRRVNLAGRWGSYGRRLVALVALALSIGHGLTWLREWFPRPTFTISDTARDLKRVVGPEAVFAGPYAFCVTADNSFGAVIHMFGVSDPDTSFFERFPVTHLALDKPNRAKFEQMYPEVAANAITLHTYWITGRTVDIVRVAGATGNPKADGYKLSSFERFVALDRADHSDSARAIVSQAIRGDSVNIALNLLLAERAHARGRVDVAERLMRLAFLASPTNYAIQAEIGKMFEAEYKSRGDEIARQKALNAFTLALDIFPKTPGVRERLDGLRATASVPLE